jgi:hypothetical protein
MASQSADPQPSCPTWSCATGAGLDAKTGSGSPKTGGLMKLPLHGFDQNRIWRAIVGLAGRQVRLHVASRAPWVDLVNDGVHGYEPLPFPG